MAAMAAVATSRAESAPVIAGGGGPVVTVASTTRMAPMRACQACGASVKPDARFCGACGVTQT